MELAGAQRHRRSPEGELAGANVYDEAGKEVGKDDSPGPKCLVKVTPAKNGKYKFVIKNAGGDNTATFEIKVANPGSL